MVPRALNEEFIIESITHDGSSYRWLSYDGVEDKHRNDRSGSYLRVINKTNTVLAERGVTFILINTTDYH